jgi:hypothetical protein
MSAYMQHLSDSDYAAMFIQANFTEPGQDAISLEPNVEVWLARHSQDHRSAFLIAVEVAKQLAQAPAPAQPPAGFAEGNREGFGDQRPDVSQMDWDAYARYRVAHGIGSATLYSATLDFLGGGR